MQSINSPSMSFLPLESSQQRLQVAQARLSSGQRINSAKDDAAGLAIAVSLSTQAQALARAGANAYDGVSMADTAEGAMSSSGDALGRMRELAVQAANGTLSPSDRQALQAEFSQLQSQVDSIASQSQFNGQNLLDGSGGGTFQVGPNAGPENTVTATLPASGNGSLGLAGTDISSAQNAQTALGAIDLAIDQISSSRGQLGAVANRLQAAADYDASTRVNTMAAASRIVDTDYASTSSQSAAAQVGQSAALSAVKAYQDAQRSVLGLISTQA